MKYDQHGQAHCDIADLSELLYANPELVLQNFRVTDPAQYNAAVDALYVDLPKLQQYQPHDQVDIAQFDWAQQQHWHMPAQYQNTDIAQWLLEKCETQEQLQRVGTELLLYQERDLFPLLRYLKYLMDTIHTHGIVHGVGRGSSVASYVLYLMGVHRIDSLYYDLDITEFLK